MKYTFNRRRSRRSGQAAGFTLIEMLSVLGIVGFLTTLTVLSVRGLGGGTSRKAAVGTLMGMFDQARMVAISDGRPTYVVFASEPHGQSQDTSALTDTMWGRAYALFEDPVMSDAASTASFLPVQRSAWLYLPTGVAFKCDSSSDNTAPSVTASLPATGDSTVFQIASRANASQAKLTLPYVKFDAMGQVVDYASNMVDATSPCLRVLLFEGTASSAGVEVCSNRAAINGTNGKQYAVDEILLKPTTGRAAYTLDPVYNLAATTSTP